MKKVLIILMMSIILISVVSAKQLESFKGDCIEGIDYKICNGEKSLLEIYKPRYLDKGITGLFPKWKKAKAELKSCWLTCDYYIETLPYDVEIDRNEISLGLNDEEFVITIPNSSIKEVGTDSVTFKLDYVDGDVTYYFYSKEVKKIIKLHSKVRGDFEYLESYTRSGEPVFTIDSSTPVWDGRSSEENPIDEAEMNDENGQITISLTEEKLSKLKYPVYIDPSLVINSGTQTIGGNQEYDYVYIENGATLYVDDSTSYLNITATENITIYGTVEGSGRGYDGGIQYQGDRAGNNGVGTGKGFGGGYDNSGDEGAGGGGGAGYGSTGGDGGDAQSASGGNNGASYGDATNKSIFNIGSGGGAGGHAGGDNGGSGKEGGDGGAGIRLNAPLIIINGTVSANGGNGGNGDTWAGTVVVGGAGGGSGGMIQLEGTNINISGATLNANGGNGGNGNQGSAGGSDDDAGGGAGASGGRIKIFYKANLYNDSTTYSVSGGSGGSGDNGGSSGQAGNTGVFSIIFDNEAPVITLNEPSNDTTSSSSTITFNCSGTDDVQLSNLSLLIDGTINETVTGSSTSLELEKGVTFADGDYNWSCIGYDNVGSSTESEVRIFSIDNTLPSINVTSPSGDFYGLGIGDSLYLNWTITEDNIDSCWYNYNGTNVSVTCGDNTTSVTIEDFTNKTITLYANDTAGNLGSDSTTWDYELIINSRTYNSTTYETSTESFILNVTYDSSRFVASSATFNYNGTNYATTKEAVADDFIFTKTLDIPLGSGSAENKSFYWTVELSEGVTPVSYNTSSLNQTVNPVNLGGCGGSNTSTAINFTAWDEKTLEKINGWDFEGFFEYYIGNGSIKKNITISEDNINEVLLCISQNTTYNLDGIIGYNDNSTGYVERNYYYYDEEISNDTLLQKLYLLNSGNSTSFILKVLNSNQQEVEGAYIYIDRYYISTNSYETVQIARTDDDGKSVGFFETENPFYRFRIYVDGILELTTDKRKVVPEEAPYTLTFVIGQEITLPWVDFEDLDDIDYSLKFNDTTNISSFSYVDSSGNFTLGRQAVYNLYGNQSSVLVCNTTSSSTTSNINCDVSAYDGSFKSVGYITRGSKEYSIAINYFTISSASDTFGYTGLLLGFFIILVAFMAGIWSPVAGIALGELGIIFLNFTGLIEFSPLFLFASLAVTVILIIILKE
jgi:hypothetical protein